MRLPLLWDREATPPPPRMETSPPPKLESSDDTADSNAIVVSVGWCMKRCGRGLRDANGLSAAKRIFALMVRTYYSITTQKPALTSTILAIKNSTG